MEIVVARLGIFLGRLADLDQQFDRLGAVRRVGEPGDALVGGGEHALGGRQVGGGPAPVHGHAGERQVLHVVGGIAERDEARRLGLEVERRQHDGGVDDAGLERGEARRGDPRGEGRVVALLQPVRRHHPLEIDRGDVVIGAGRDGLALEVVDRLELGLPIST